MRRSTTLALACALFAAPVHADIYTWTDGNGVINVSNLAPPAGARLSNVTVEPAVPAARADAAREAVRQAELQMLADRVRQLETEAQTTPAPAPVAMAPVVIAPVYVPMPAPGPMPVLAAPYGDPANAYAASCDPLVLGCTNLYAPSVIVVSSIPRRHSPFTTKPLGGPVVWPRGNLAALGPWAPTIAAHRRFQPPRP